MKRKIVSFVVVVGIIFCFLLSAKSYESPNLVLMREESNGVLNMIYCDIQIEKEINGDYKNYKEYVISRFEILDELYEYDKSELMLAGGEKLVLSIQPGKYRMKCFTPISKQSGYLNNNTNWESEYVYIDIKRNNIISFVINPMFDNSGYSGNWEIKKIK